MPPSIRKHNEANEHILYCDCFFHHIVYVFLLSQFFSGGECRAAVNRILLVLYRTRYADYIVHKECGIRDHSDRHTAFDWISAILL